MFQLIGQGNAANAVTLSTNVAVLVGRSDSCGVQLNDPSASRVHCRVIAHDGRVKLYDAGSRWGTFVNGQRVTECDLRPGDRIQVGETTLQLTTVSDANDVTLHETQQHRVRVVEADPQATGWRGAFDAIF